MTEMNDLLIQALELPLPDRAALARQLLLSLETEPFDADHEEAWNAEILERMELVKKGEFTASDWREAVERIRLSIKPG